MKRARKILTVTIMTIIAITMLLAVLLTNTVSNAGGSYGWSDIWSNGISAAYGNGSKERYGFLVTDETVSQYNNIYCISAGGRLTAGKTVSWWSGYSNLYNVTAVVTLSGNPEGTGTVKFYSHGSLKSGDKQNQQFNYSNGNEGIDQR